MEGDPDSAGEVLLPGLRDNQPAASALPCDAARLHRLNLLATILHDKFGMHQSLNRQSERYAHKGIDLSLATLADQVGAGAQALRPLHDLIATHVLKVERLHSDDTTVPILAKGQTITGHAWVYVRDDRPFGGGAPATWFQGSRDRRGAHPVVHLADWSGILQADAYGGYNDLYRRDRQPGPVTSALCCAHARREFFELADIAAAKRRGKTAPPISPIALEAIKRIGALFDIAREINGLLPKVRLTVRQERSTPLVVELEAWMQGERARLSRSAPVAQVVDYMLPRWPAFTRFLDDGRICLTNNAAERALRCLASAGRLGSLPGRIGVPSGPPSCTR